MENQRIPLTFRFTKQLEHVLFSSFAAVVFYQVINLLRPGRGDLAPLFKGHVWAYVQELFSFYIAFEPISIFILFSFLNLYVRVFKLNSIKAEWSALFIYLAKLFPVFALSIFIFGPVTNTIRFFALYYPQKSLSEYYPEYFFTWKMYSRYFVPVFFFGYAHAAYCIFRDYDDWQRHRLKQLLSQSKGQGSEPSFLSQISILDEQGKGILSVNDITYFEVVGKKYFAHTLSKKFEIEATLTELETLLDDTQFFRANRATIINLKFFKNYSFWENDKYIVRLNGINEEFSVQRTRLKELKEILKMA